MNETSTTTTDQKSDTINDSVLGFALKIILEELNCIIIDNGHIAIVKYATGRLKLEKRDGYWYDLEKNIKFHSRSQIAIYVARHQLRQ